MTRSILMSLLVRQHLALKAAFNRRYPHGWLVWEAGAWNVTETGDQNIAATQLPTAELRDCLPTGDVLCFELAPRDGLTVGRSSSNDVVLNDATVSREHLVLRHNGSGWSVEVTSQNNATLNGQTLAQGAATPLENGDRISVGDVNLSFYEPAGFEKRISGEEQRLLQATADAARRPRTSGRVATVH